MDRRDCLTLLATLGAGALLLGHTPYRQWEVYRKLRLIILTSAEDAQSLTLAEAVAALLARHLPESRATVARARDSREVVRLLASRQIDVALLRIDEARDALEGQGRFVDPGALPLRALAILGSHLLVCRDDFAVERAHRIAKALVERWSELGGEPAGRADASGPSERAAIPFHPGALDYYQARWPRQ